LEERGETLHFPRLFVILFVMKKVQKKEGVKLKKTDVAIDQQGTCADK